MKKVITICITFVLILSLAPSAFAEVDLSKMSRDELILLKNQIDEILKNSFDEDSYIKAAKEDAAAMYASALDFANILNYARSFSESLKKIGGSYKAEEGKERSLKWFNEKTGKSWDYLESEREKCLSLHRNLMNIDTFDNKKCNDIKEKMQDLFEAYNGLYYATDSPSLGQITSGGKAIDKFDTVYKNLSDLYFLY